MCNKQFEIVENLKKCFFIVKKKKCVFVQNKLLSHFELEMVCFEREKTHFFSRNCEMSVPILHKEVSKNQHKIFSCNIYFKDYKI